jgi:hypothetical protein
MKLWILGVAAALSLVTVGSIRHAPVALAANRCTSQIGWITTSRGGARHQPCRTGLDYLAKLFPGDRLRTTDGTVTFHTFHLRSCRMIHHSSDVIFPRKGIALAQSVGRTTCTTGSQRRLKLRGPGVSIQLRKVRGRTILELSSTRKGTVVKVVKGKVRVAGLKKRGARIVRSGRQVTVRKGKRPQKPKPLVLDAEEKESVDLVTKDTPETGPSGVGAVFTRLGNPKGLVLAQDEAIRRIVESRLRSDGRDVVGFTREQFFGDPDVRRQIDEMHPRISVIAGDFDQMRPVLTALRAELGTEALILFMPFVARDLRVSVRVVNDNGGHAVPADFTMTVSGGNPTPSSFPGSETGTDVSLDAGSYGVDAAGPAGYTVSRSAECAGTIADGEAKDCTITADDQPGHLLVIKHVINDDGGGLIASQFVLTVSGSSPSPSSFAGSETGTDVTLDPGSYSVEEGGQAQYTESKSADCSGTIALGESKTCTITNDDVPGADP